MYSTTLSGTDYPVTETSYAQAFWLLRRYSSFTYIAHMYRLIATFVTEYEKHCVSKGESATWMRDVFGQLYGWQGRLEKGLARLRLGDRSGYAGIFAGLGFGPYLKSPRFEYGRDFDDIGFHQFSPATGLWAWGDRAVSMAFRTRMTISTQWSFETLLDQFAPIALPGHLPPFPVPGGGITAEDADAPTSGVWLPVDVPMSCPNYRIEGGVVLGVRIPSSRTDIPALPAEYGAPATPARRFYEFTDVPTRWQLVWEDRRYVSGDLPPEEAEYLDESTSFPNDAVKPVAPFLFRKGS